MPTSTRCSTTTTTSSSTSCEDLATEASLDVHRDADTTSIAFAPPADLIRRLRDLPSDLHRANRASTSACGYRQHEVRRVPARPRPEPRHTAWPDVHFLAPIHPVLEWAAERGVARFGRNEIPVLSGDVDEPVFLTQAVWSNALGQPVARPLGRDPRAAGPPGSRRLRPRARRGRYSGTGQKPGRRRRLCSRSCSRWCRRPSTRRLRTSAQARRPRPTLRRIDSYRERLEGWQAAAL